ncbi:DoxX family multipass membrane protein [Oleiphilus messinensis]|uniref:DoxX family multipass membrane protein n=1 Tax=Oleiphilus messinensis TaxID=141451 RepID=A0A1Y0IEZ2_9GAMM|nr:DoxX family protein [Oleiphilus messinensis]ARU59108.1 DoxX family multipass membrane protein [Oleiphilus messinensis]
MSQYQRIGLGFVFLWFMGGGIGHFVMTDFFVNIMPPQLPLHYEAVYISGVFEILGALGLLIPATRRWAGYGLIALTICVTPANVHMWMNPELYPEFPEWALTARLVIQALLLACIAWSTRPVESTTDSQPAVA